ncbi:MAG: hypothetical protein P8074_08255 [Anaerolineales bacterium]|jgi:hypothetical protein
MYSLEKYFLVEEQRRIEKMAEAERYRLLKSTRHLRLVIYRRWLASLGATLVDLGCRLQTHYKPVSLADFEQYVELQESTPCSS